MTRVIGVGLGQRGRKWVQWARKAGAEVVGVVDANPETLAAVGAELGFDMYQRFTSVELAVAALAPEAAVVCAPHHVHPVLARACLEQGLHVLVEKPLAQDIATAQALVDLAEGEGLQLVIAQQYRYSEAVQRLRDLLQGGVIGQLTGGLVQFYRWRPTQGMKLPLLLNQSIHHFDGLRFLMDATPKTCTAELWDPAWNGCDGPTATEATFRFADGTRVHYSGSYVAKGAVTHYDALWRFEGSEGQLTYDGNRTIVHTPPDGQAQVIDVNARTGEATVDLCRDFLDSLRTGSLAPTHAADNLHTLAMAFAIEESARAGRTVTLSELLGDRVSVVQGGE